MKKNLKKVLTILGVIFFIYIVLVIVDSIKIRYFYNYGLFFSKPIFTISEEENEKSIKYSGIGYSVQYYIEKEQKYDFVLVKIYGAEFRLFDKILIWAWIN